MVRLYTQNEVVWAAIPVPKAFGIRDPNSQPLLKFKAEIFPNYFDLGIPGWME